MVNDVLVPLIKRPVEELRDRLPIGPAEACAKKLGAYARAGVERIFVWPLTDELTQLRVFMERVVPRIDEP